MILKLLHKIYRNDEFIKNFAKATNLVFNSCEEMITRIANLFYFDKLDVKSCEWWEKFLKITEISLNLESRRARIRAKWLSSAHNDILLIQTICDSWKDGDVEADFINGKINLKFVGEYGIPEDLEGLTNSVGEIKPTHLPLVLIYKHLLIEDIHEVKSLEEMEQIQMFCFAG